MSLEPAKPEEGNATEKTMRTIAYVTILLTFGLFIIVAYHNIPQTSHDAIMLLLGVIVGAFKDVYGYFFGSSSGSSAKSQTISDQLAKK